MTQRELNNINVGDEIYDSDEYELLKVSKVYRGLNTAGLQVIHYWKNDYGVFHESIYLSKQMLLTDRYRMEV